ncbi:MAG: cation-efflux pump [Candidatus Korarchaeota archaeon]|nr:cation-efflux pump [Candidatus Korarchaeota archaeon]
MRKSEIVAISSIMISLLIVAIKLITALITGSIIVLAEVIDSLGDVLTSSITWIGIRISSRPPDADHPYGHEKFDSLLGLLSSVILLEVEGYVIYKAVISLIGRPSPPIVTNEAIFLLLLTSIINVGRSLALWFTGGSEGVRMMQSEAINYGWDAGRTLIVVLVLMVSSEIIPWLDPLSAIIATTMVIPSTARVAYWSASDLLDRIDPSLLSKAQSLISECEEVESIRKVRARRIGKSLLIDAVVAIDPSLTAEQSQEVIRKVERRLSEELKAKDVLIMITPSGPSRESMVRNIVLKTNGVKGVHSTDFYGDRKERLSLHVIVDKEMNLKEAHKIAEEIETSLKRRLGLEEVMVHIDHVGERIEAEEVIRRVKELKDVKWVKVNSVRSEDELRLEIRVGADPNLSVKEVNKLEHDVEAILAELVPGAKASVRIVPSCEEVHGSTI